MINSILSVLNLRIIRPFPRYAVRKAKDYFLNNPIKIIEVGTYKGENALSMIENLNTTKIYLVDSYSAYKQEDYGFEKDNNNSIGKDAEEMENARQEAHRKLDVFPEVQFIEMDSKEAVEHIKEHVDFIYIDGNHDYECVLNDLKNYFPLLKENGIISGHDAHLIPVMKAVAEFAYKNKLPLSVRDSDWVIFMEDTYGSN